MFPHTITIYRYINDTYTRKVLNGFYVMPSKSFSIDGKGLEKSKGTDIVSSPENAASYGTKWDIQENDRIYIGTGAEITTIKNLDSLTVTGVDVNVCGSPVDNIVIHCV